MKQIKKPTNSSTSDHEFDLPPPEELNFQQAEFILSADRPSYWVSDLGAEVGFVGRSNVGKSTALNLITNRKGLAKTSKTPGRTQHLVFFGVSDNQRLVDLPGYGFAKTPISVRRNWEKVIMGYLAERRSLRGLVVPMDIRRPFTPLDEQMINWLIEIHLPFHVLLTKADKLSRGKAESVLLKVQRRKLEEVNGSVQLFSALKRQGLEQAREKISGWLQDPQVEKRLL